MTIGTPEERKLAARIALRIKDRLPKTVPVEDLMQAATIGLWRALEGMPVDCTPEHRIAYLKLRIRGRVIDELRAMDWFTRAARKTGAKLFMKYDEMLDTPQGGDNIEHLIIAKSATDLAMQKLNHRSRDIIRQMMQGYSQEEISKRLGLTASRVSQIYKAALETMREVLDKS